MNINSIVVNHVERMALELMTIMTSGLMTEYYGLSVTVGWLSLPGVATQRANNANVDITKYRPQFLLLLFHQN